MSDITVLSPQVSVWGTMISVLQILLLLWFGTLILFGSWKLFRWLIKCKP
ncbi:hypothetical protein KAR02_05665 [Candidatus Bipolaricaulota bacterium]|nr:hypothetical protein [Candidatus Bipolaricaulota bacterium]